MFEQLFCVLADEWIHFFEQLQTLVGDFRVNNALVFRLASAADELLLLQATKQTGDVRITADHALADFGASEALVACSAQNAKDVVLRRRNAVRFEELLPVILQPVGCALNIEQRFFFHRCEGAGLFDFFLQPAGHVLAPVKKIITANRDKDGMIRKSVW